jgi:hypothetical protein
LRDYYNWWGQGIEKKILKKFKKKFRITKTSQRQPISPTERLMVTLRYLGTGDSFHSLSYNFRMGVSWSILILVER